MIVILKRSAVLLALDVICPQNKRDQARSVFVNWCNHPELRHPPAKDFPFVVVNGWEGQTLGYAKEQLYHVMIGGLCICRFYIQDFMRGEIDPNYHCVLTNEPPVRAIEQEVMAPPPPQWNPWQPPANLDYAANQYAANDPAQAMLNDIGRDELERYQALLAQQQEIHAAAHGRILNALRNPIPVPVNAFRLGNGLEVDFEVFREKTKERKIGVTKKPLFHQQLPLP